MNHPLLLGHRGARAVWSIRENTIESFDRALEHGCDGFEFDVRRTSDAQAVIWHDPESSGMYIEEAEARQLPRLERLSAVLERYHQRAFLDIELKVPGLEELTVELLRRYPPKKGAVVSSFLASVIAKIHALDPTVSLGLICETKAELSHWRHLPLGYVIAHHELLTNSLALEVQSAGKKIFVWTVNGKRDMERFAELGVDGIISDKTDLLCQTLKNKAEG